MYEAGTEDSSFFWVIARHQHNNEEKGFDAHEAQYDCGELPPAQGEHSKGVEYPPCALRRDGPGPQKPEGDSLCHLTAEDLTKSQGFLRWLHDVRLNRLARPAFT
jgi:hypothetical protein